MTTKYIPTLTIAGSDSSGGAGIQADIKTMSALGCYAMSVITAVTAQNTCGVSGVEAISNQLVQSQLEAVLEDIPPKAIKTGMLYDRSTIEVIVKTLSQLDDIPPIIVDPVMVATSGDSLFIDEAIESLINSLLPMAALVTPNIPEAEALAGLVIDSHKSIKEAAKKILSYGVEAVLIKGGHLMGDDCPDFLFLNNGHEEVFHGTKVRTSNTHGTGCTLSSAITAYIARGLSLPEAVGQAKVYISEAINSGKDITLFKGHGPVDHFYNPQKSIKL